MIKNIKITKWLLGQMYLLHISEMSPRTFIDGYIGKEYDYPEFRWKLAVDVIEKCLKGGGLLDDDGWSELIGLGVDGFIVKLSEINPFSASDEDISVWMDPLLYKTKYGEIFLSQFFSNGFNPDDESLLSSFSEKWHEFEFSVPTE
jgi:hypothetical protein